MRDVREVDKTPSAVVILVYFDPLSRCEGHVVRQGRDSSNGHNLTLTTYAYGSKWIRGSYEVSSSLPQAMRIITVE
jgi:hypothetical protein